MNESSPARSEQQAMWNGTAGQGWVDEQALLDEMYRPFEALLLQTVPDGADLSVLDVGCGTGGTSVAIARRLGPGGRCVGVDVSAPMIAAAAARDAHGRASFVCADAQTHAFEAAAFDRIVSRFGVMFFDAPVQAFANLRRAARPGAAMRFIAWRDAAQNPFMTTAERAAAPLLPGLPARRPDGPGQFAFADPAQVRAILQAGGWSDVTSHAIDVDCAFPEPALARHFTKLGPLARVLPSADEATRRRVIDAVRAAFQPFVHDGQVRFSAACWRVDACAGGACRD